MGSLPSGQTTGYLLPIFACSMVGSPISWRQEFGGLKTDQVKRMKELKAENARLRRAISDLTLDKMILAEAAKRNF